MGICQVIAVVNQKGGMGKTTTCCNLGIGLAQEGKRVLLVDCDPQASLTISLGHPQPDELPITLTDIELEVLICKIYEDNILGKLPDARYAALDEQYAKEQGALSVEIKELETAVHGFEKCRKSAERFITLVEKYENFDTLTTTMLNEFVEKIHVHERDRKGCAETTQEVEIFFNFVGRYVPPHFGEVNLTQEEQEELRKREERRDRLHQYYLQRKAKGKVAEDYERVKAKKKAEMDAKKKALRVEDISKGVFIAVNSLPKKEPRIAEKTA